MVPAMIYLIGMPTAVVVGTSLFQICFVAAVTGFLHAYNNHSVDILLALLLVAGGVVGTQFGSRFGGRLRAEHTRVLLAILVLLVCGKPAWDLVAPPRDPTRSRRRGPVAEGAQGGWVRSCRCGLRSCGFRRQRHRSGSPGRSHQRSGSSGKDHNPSSAPPASVGLERGRARVEVEEGVALGRVAKLVSHVADPGPHSPPHRLAGGRGPARHHVAGQPSPVTSLGPRLRPLGLALRHTSYVRPLRELLGRRAHRQPRLHQALDDQRASAVAAGTNSPTRSK